MNPISPPSSLSPRKRRLDKRIASQAVTVQELARIQASLRRHRIPRRDRTDVAQDIVLAALEAQEKHVEVVDRERWVNGILVNHVRRWRWRRYVELTRIEADDEEIAGEGEPIDKTFNPEEFLMSEERRRLLYQFLDELPVDHLDAVVAREFEGLTFEEIAVAFERPVSTVHGYYKAGMRELREACERWKAKQRNRGALLLPLTLEALFEADRTAPPEPPNAEEIDRLVRRAESAPRNAPPDSAPASGTRRRNLRRSIDLMSTLPIIGYLLAGQPDSAAARGGSSPFAGVATVATPIVQPAVPATPAAMAGLATQSALAAGALDAITAMPASAAPATSGSHVVTIPSSTARVDSDELNTEQEMLEKARSAFIQENMQGALTALEEYEQKYPGGVHARELDRTQIMVLVGLGRTVEACRRAESFRRAYPRSTLPTELGPLCAASRRRR